MASGNYSHAEGYRTTAFGQSSHAEGSDTMASGDHSHAEGYRTTAFGQSSHAEGSDTMASGDHSHAEGYGNVTSITLTGDAGVVEYTTSTTNASSYKGCKFIYNGQLFTVINTSGSIVTLDKTLSGTENINNLQLKVYKSYASGKYSHVEGYDTTASGDWAHAEGIRTIANYQGSHAQGSGTIASSVGAHAEGVNTVAKASASHAEGWGTIAKGVDSHVQGKFNIANQFEYAHIVGNGESDTARSNAHTLDWNGVGWFASGLKVGGTSQYDPNAKEVALNSEATTTAAGLMSAADKTKVNGIATNLVNGSAPNSLRSVSAASEDASYSLGQCAFATGSSTKASGNNSHAEGSHTIAASAGQHAQGKYNVEDSASKYAHIVGNGSSDTTRSNAHTLDWNGNAWFAGNIYIGGTGQDDATAVKVAIVPFPTASDEGKILRVVNGTPTWVSIQDAEGGSF